MKTDFSPRPLAGEGPGVRGLWSANRRDPTAGIARPLNGSRNTQRWKLRKRRDGFSLLEVILALAILTGAIAVLGELVRLGARNAADTRAMTQAELLCESKLAQITSGMLLPDSVVAAPFDPADLIDPYDPVTWAYSIEVDAVEEPGIVAVRVTVGQDLPQGHHPVHYSLVRWIADPGIELSEQPTAKDGQDRSKSGSQKKSPTEAGGTRDSRGATP